MLCAMASVDWAEVFVPAKSLLEIILRGTLVYLGLFVMLRIVPKRQSGMIGVTYSAQRVVRSGKVLTSAGASAGIDLALTLLDLSHGPAVAQAVQLALEYDPQPPYDAGTPAKAPADIGELVSSYYAQRCP